MQRLIYILLLVIACCLAINVGIVVGSFNDNDDGSGSGDGSGDDDYEKTACEKLRDKMMKGGYVGAYVPRCTVDGDYEKVQCNTALDECWCVGSDGNMMSKTKVKRPKTPNCDIDAMNALPTQPSRGEDSSENSDLYYPSSTKISNHIPAIGKDNNGWPESIKGQETEYRKNDHRRDSLIQQPGLLAAIIGGAVVGLLCAILLVMFIVYRMRKKDEGSYPLDEPKRATLMSGYQRANTKEVYA